MTDIKERAEQIKAIATETFGRVIKREGDAIEIEVPADLAIGLNATWGRMGLVAINMGTETRLAPRRIMTDSGHIIAIKEQPVTTAFCRLRIGLGKEAPKAGDPMAAVGAITATRGRSA